MVIGIGKVLGMVIAIILIMVALYFILSGNKKTRAQGQWVISQSPEKLGKLSKAEASMAIFNEHKYGCPPDGLKPTGSVKRGN